MFLIDDHETDIVEILRMLQQAVRTDDDVDSTRAQTGDDILDFLRGLKTRQDFDPDRPVGETIAKILAMLLCEQGRGTKYGNLLATVYCCERRAQGYLCLAEADVTTDHPIHGLVSCQVGKHIVDCVRLVVSQFERKARFETAVIFFGPVKAMARPCRTPRIDIQQFRRDIANLLDRALLGLAPLVAAQPVQRGVVRRCARISRNQVERVYGHIQLVAVCVFEMQELCLDATSFEGYQTQVTADAVFLMDDR